MSPLSILDEVVKPNAKVLDLGCGSGDLLASLQQKYNVSGYGIDIKFEHIVECIEKGISCFQGNLDEGLSQFSDQSFDVVILSFTLQQVHKPLFLLKEMSRVGKKVVITFPNFGYWRIRLHTMLGKSPRTKTLPYHWYDTPNIRVITFSDFRHLCKQEGYQVLTESTEFLPLPFRVFGTLFNNFFSKKGVFILRRK